jgi:hypothetical protein
MHLATRRGDVEIIIVIVLIGDSSLRLSEIGVHAPSFRLKAQLQQGNMVGCFYGHVDDMVLRQIDITVRFG